MNRRTLFQAITGAIVASAMELGFVDKPRMICGFDPPFAHPILQSDPAIILSGVQQRLLESGAWSIKHSPRMPRFDWNGKEWVEHNPYPEALANPTYYDSRIREQSSPQPSQPTP